MFELLQIMAQTGPASMDDEERERFLSIRPLFEEIGQEEDVAPALLAAVAKRESRDFRPDSHNPETDALGIMQVIPSTAEQLGIPYGDLTDPAVAIRAGALDLKAKGYGSDPLPEVLEGYGGFVPPVRFPGGRDDPGPYIRYILTAYWAMWAHHGLSLRPASFGL